MWLSIGYSSAIIWRAQERRTTTTKLPRLKEWRERRALTQAELAKLSGVAEPTINRIERGHHEPRVTTARRLAAALGVSPAKLTDYPDEERVGAAA
jgi:transcriptional regulator with XRE-family HTH domain